MAKSKDTKTAKETESIFKALTKAIVSGNPKPKTNPMKNQEYYNSLNSIISDLENLANYPTKSVALSLHDKAIDLIKDNATPQHIHVIIDNQSIISRCSASKKDIDLIKNRIKNSADWLKELLPIEGK